MRIRRLLTGATVTAAALLTGACGGGGTEGVAANLSADTFSTEIATATRAETSTHLEATLDFQGQTMTMTGDVATSERLEDLTASLAMDIPGESPLELRIVDGSVYLKGAGVSGEAGKPWITVDLSDPSNPLARYYEQLVANANPAQSAKIFEAVTELDNRGEDEVDGVQATHYEVTVDMAKALELTGVTEAGVLEPGDLGGRIPDEVTYDVWLETDTALIVRMTMELQGLEMDVHFSDWGQQVSVQAPPASAVTELDF